MLFITTLVLTFSAVINALTFQKCEGFLEAQPNSKFTPSFEITAGAHEVSVLMFHLNDVLTTNIDPFHFSDSNLLDSTDNDFFLCTQNLLDAGKCDQVGEFHVVVNPGAKTSAEILNEPLAAGKTLTYKIESKGVYCSYLYSADPRANVDVKIRSIQAFGYASMEKHYKQQFFKYIVLPLSILVSILSFIGLRKSKTLHQEVALEFYIFCFTLFVIVYNIFKLINLIILNDVNIFGSGFIGKIFVSLIFPDQYIMIAPLIIILRGLSCGYFGILTKDIKPKYTPIRFNIFLVAYISTYALVGTANILGYSGISGKLNFVISLASIGMFYYLVKNSGRTMDKIEDVRDKRNYKISRILSIWMPFMIFLVSVVAAGIIGFKSAQSIAAESNYDPLKDGQKEIMIKMLQKTLLDPKIFFLNFIPELLFTILGLIYTLIWFGKSPNFEFSEVNGDEEFVVGERDISSDPALKNNEKNQNFEKNN